jgi:hypothetical protein
LLSLVAELSDDAFYATGFRFLFSLVVVFANAAAFACRKAFLEIEFSLLAWFAV